MHERKNNRRNHAGAGADGAAEHAEHDALHEEDAGNQPFTRSDGAAQRNLCGARLHGQVHGGCRREGGEHQQNPGEHAHVQAQVRGDGRAQALQVGGGFHVNLAGFSGLERQRNCLGDRLAVASFGFGNVGHLAASGALKCARRDNDRIPEFVAAIAGVEKADDRHQLTIHPDAHTGCHLRQPAELNAVVDGG